MMLVFWRPTTVVNLSETVWSVIQPFENLFFIILTHIDLLFKFFYEYGFDFADIFACAHRFLEFLNVVYAVLRNLLHRFFSWFELIWISCRFYAEVQGFEVIILTKRCQWYASSDFALSLQPLYTVALTCYKDRGVFIPNLRFMQVSAWPPVAFKGAISFKHATLKPK